ncbi:MAG: hypothetical protein IKH65_08945 [Clostridia bacterium]|nr:hypothetical protein [Clostridia bacterium]
MKKIISLILCLTVVLSAVSLSAFADGEKISDNPVVLVPGYSASYFYNADTGEHVWGLESDDIGNMVLSYIVEVGAALGALTVGNSDKIATLVGNAILDLAGELACNPDGTSKYNIKRYFTKAEDSRYSVITEKYGGKMNSEIDICAQLAPYIGYDNIYQFNCDFRMGQEDCARQLDEFIEDVCRFTGKDKVNIVSVSHGGQTTSTYTVLYGYKNRIDSAVLTVPAIGGAAFLSDSFSGNVHLEEDCITRFVEFSHDMDIDINWLMKAYRLGFLDEICEKLVPYAYQVIGNWGSIWDFAPADNYENMKSRLLDPVANAEIIKKSDRYHYEIQPLVAEKFNECREQGADISIIAGTGQPVVTGGEINSDGIISTFSATGATVAPLGSRFPDGYVQKNDCDGKYKVSPAMTVDASTAYLPDNTWFFEDVFHGRIQHCPISLQLMTDLLLTDRIKDVYTDPAYPQFNYSNAPADTVYFKFENSNPGFIGNNPGNLLITNCSKQAVVTLTAVTVDGADFGFKLPLNAVLRPGETVKAEVKGDIPAVGRKAVNITVCYLINTVTPQGYRTVAFTLMNGRDAAPGYGYTANGITPLGRILGEDFSGFLKKHGLYEYFSMLFEVWRYFFDFVRN